MGNYTTWNDSTERFHFRKRLSEDIKDELSRIDTPNGLDDLNIKIDRRFMEKQKSVGFNTSFNLQPMAKNFTSSEPEPMQIGFL